MDSAYTLFKLGTSNSYLYKKPADSYISFSTIDSQGKLRQVLIFLPGASGQISSGPNGTGLFSYHCEYYLDTMKGTIR